MSQNHIGDPDEKVSGMGQERTEQPLTLEKLQREMKGKIGFGPNAERTRILIEGFKKWPESFERWVDEGNYYGWDVDSFIRLIWEKDGEIDRLNAVNSDLTAKVQERDGQIEHMTLVISDQDEGIREMNDTISDLTAKERERDKEIDALEYVREKDKEFLRSQIAGRDQAIAEVKRERNKEIERLTREKNEWLSKARAESGISLKSAEENAELREEIERLRSALEQFEKMPIERSNSTAMQMRAIANAALKGENDGQLKSEADQLRAEIEFARKEFDGIGVQAYAIGEHEINRRAIEAGNRMFATLKGAE